MQEELIERARRHDNEAFAEIYRAHFDRVYRYLRFKLGSEVEAEDMTQQVFLKAYRALPSYNYRKIPLSAWIMRIAHNEMVDYYRRHSRLRIAALETAVVVAPEDPVEEAEIHTDIDTLKQAMTTLSPAQREVVSLRFGSGLSLAEVAEVMGKSVGAIKTLQHNGLVRLREAIRGEGGA